MTKTFSAKSSLQMVTAVTIVFMCLNAFLPLNLSSVEAEATAYPFKLKIILEKTAYKSRELVNVTGILTNIGEDNLTLYHSADIEFDFIVYDENFLHVFQYSNEWFIPAIYLPFPPIPPNNNVTLTGFWNQIYDGSGKITPELWGKRVPSGTYYVTGFFLCTTYKLRIQTPAIRITIIGG